MIAVITLLMAILLPCLQRVRRQAKAVICQSNLRDWGLIFSMYTEDNGGYFHSGDIRDWRHLWMGALWPYYCHSKDICCCPMAVKRSGETRRGFNEISGTFTTWSVPTGYLSWDREELFGSYGLNGWTRSPPRDLEAQYGGHFPTKYNWRSPDVKGANGVPVFLDCRSPYGWMKAEFGPSEYEEDPGWVRFCMNRHNRHVNGLFMDWSVKKVGLKEVWTLKWHREFDTAGPWTKAGGVQPEDWPQWMRRFKDY